jgi:hypothetical protein
MAVAKQDQVDAVFKVGVGGTKLTGGQFILKAEDILLQNIESALLRLGFNLADKLEANAPMDSGAMKRSFGSPNVIETKLGYRVEIPTGADYYDYIDKGVRGIEHSLKNKRVFLNDKNEYYQFRKYGMPLEALKQLEGWMERKNMEIDARNLRVRAAEKGDPLKGRRILPQISSSAQRMAYYIKKYGIAGTNFIKKSVDEATPQFKVDIQKIGSDSLVLRISK